MSTCRRCSRSCWRASTAVFGDSLLVVRLIAAPAGAGLVVLTAALARELGGGRWAQASAGVCVIVAPIYLIMHGFTTMNALDPLFWVGCALVLARILNGGDPRLWLLFGLIAGLGVNSKHTFALWGASMVVGLLATRARSAFRSRWIWLGGLVALALVSAESGVGCEPRFSPSRAARQHQRSRSRCRAVLVGLFRPAGAHAQPAGGGDLVRRSRVGALRGARRALPPPGRGLVGHDARAHPPRRATLLPGAGPPGAARGRCGGDRAMDRSGSRRVQTETPFPVNTWVTTRPSRAEPFADPDFFFVSGTGHVLDNGLTNLFSGIVAVADYLGIPSSGGEDIFLRRRDSIADDFGAAFSPGAPLNSSGEEFLAVLPGTGSTIYFNSTRPGAPADGLAGFVNLWQAPIAEALVFEVNPAGHRNRSTGERNRYYSLRFCRPRTSMRR